MPVEKIPMDSELTQEVLNLKDGDHLCLFYDKDPAEQMPALVPFIHDGLTKHEQFIYIADDQTVDELAGRLEQSGINLATEIDRGALKLWTRREWRQPGRLSAKKKSLQVLDFINEAVKSGFKGSRFAVEMTWALGPDIRPAALEAWEATLNTIFVPGFQGRITCQYNRSRLAPEVMLAALHTHPVAILGDHVYPNWFYEAPLILSGNGNGNNKSSAARVEWMISVLERSRIAQKEREELIEQRAVLAETELSRQRIENILSLMPVAVYTCDAEGRITFYNRHAADLWHREPKLNDGCDKFCGSFRLWRPDGSPMSHAETPMADAVKTGASSRNTQIVVERSDGSTAVVSVNIDPLFDANGRRCGAINVFQDVTELKKAEDARMRLATIVESSDDAIISKDLNGVITSWNQAAERLFGYTAEEAIGQPITILIPQDHIDEEPGILARIRRGERIEHYETIRQRKDGSSLELSLTVSPMKNRAGTIIGASKIARDITARKQAEAALREARDDLAKANEELEKRVNDRTAALKQANAALLREMEEQQRLEEQLRQAQKMEGIGTLAGGIAHDFNNILNIIKGYASLIEHDPSADEKISESVSVIDESIERGASVVRQLLTLARKTESHLASADVNDVVSALANLLRQTFPKTIDISLELRPKLPAVLADPNQINQALLNLCVNARDAMPNGGKLKLRTKVVDAGQLQNSTVVDRPYVCVEIADTGTGIDESIRPRLFEPFFTTKGVGEGTGLGLAMVYGIVKNHNGFVDVESEPKRGTIFRLYIPVMPSAEKAMTIDAKAAKVSSRQRSNGQRTLLLAEDEQAMVFLLTRTLSNHGYNVLAALDGEEAIDVYRRHKHEIDVVLLDIGLPKLAGWDVILKLKEANPNVNVVVTSGYIDPSFKAKMHQVGINDFIAKPYTPDTILQALQAIFEKPNSTYLRAAPL
jgi:two-component system cell cycle sensor histidine kinase/response regulator CckA